MTSTEKTGDLITAGRLERLTRFHSDVDPIVSLYLDLRPQERDKRRLASRLNNLIRQTEADLAGEPKDRLEAFRKEMDHLRDWLTTKPDLPGLTKEEKEHLPDWTTLKADLPGRGLVVFSAAALNLWQVFTLPVPVKDRLLVSDRPYLRPLLTLIDEYERYLVVLLDKQQARLFITYLGAIEECTELESELVPHTRAGGLSAPNYQRHHETHVLWHVKRVVKAADRLWRRELCDWLVVGGNPEAVAQLLPHLPKAMMERLAGEIRVAVEAPLTAVLAETLLVEEEVERRTEAERVEQLLTAALGHGPGVLGLEETLTAIVAGNVLTLVVEEDFAQPGFECPNCGNLGAHETRRCPLCDQRVDPQADVVERAGERALAQDATLEVLRGANRLALADHGHIGALLRYSTVR